MADLEARGIPGAFVTTVEFIKAAETQARALGVEPSAVFIDHPIQDRTDPEMDELADGAVEYERWSQARFRPGHRGCSAPDRWRVSGR